MVAHRHHVNEAATAARLEKAMSKNRWVSLLGVLVLLVSLVVVAGSPAGAADENVKPCPKPVEDVDVVQGSDDCKPDRICKDAFGDKETAKLVWSNYKSYITDACCIEWDTQVAQWAEPFLCDPPLCYDVFGERAEEIVETYGDLITSTCCIDVDALANIPAQDQKWICIPVEPPPTTVPEPTPEPEPEPEPEPTPVIQVVERTVVQTRPAFTG